MGCSVFAESMGLFHKGSGGKGVAPGDVCLSPPPPPTGPAPVPYVNNLQASNLTKGSKKVKIQGEPTALENKSEISTSVGNEAGTQGGNVVTHKTKGKGFFNSWSFTVKIEDKGVCRHGDMMGQNCTSTPPGCVDMAALTSFLLMQEVEIKPCDKPYKRTGMGLGPNDDQTASVRGGPCWECVRDLPAGNWESITMRSGKVKAKASAYTSERADSKQFTADHQPPLNIAWYMGGCHMGEEKFKEWANSRAAVKPHCAAHSSSQGGTVGAVTRNRSGQAAFDACKSFLGF